MRPPACFRDALDRHGPDCRIREGRRATRTARTRRVPRHLPVEPGQQIPPAQAPPPPVRKDGAGRIDAHPAARRADASVQSTRLRAWHVGRPGRFAIDIIGARLRRLRADEPASSSRASGVAAAEPSQVEASPAAAASIVGATRGGVHGILGVRVPLAARRSRSCTLSASAADGDSVVRLPQEVRRPKPSRPIGFLQRSGGHVIGYVT